MDAKLSIRRRRDPLSQNPRDENVEIPLRRRVAATIVQMLSPVRPWYRLHALTCIVAVAVAIALVLVNLQWSRRDSGKPVTGFDSGWFQGWPFWFSQSGLPQVGRLNGIQFNYGRLDALFGDAAVAVLIVLGTSWTLEQWCRHHKVRFSLKLLLSVMAWIACVIALIIEWGEDWTGAMYTTAIVITYSALALTWLAAFDVSGLAWNWIVNLRR